MCRGKSWRKNNPAFYLSSVVVNSLWELIEQDFLSANLLLLQLVILLCEYWWAFVGGCFSHLVTGSITSISVNYSRTPCAIWYAVEWKVLTICYIWHKEWCPVIGHVPQSLDSFHSLYLLFVGFDHWPCALTLVSGLCCLPLMTDPIYWHLVTGFVWRLQGIGWFYHCWDYYLS